MDCLTVIMCQLVNYIKPHISWLLVIKNHQWLPIFPNFHGLANVTKLFNYVIVVKAFVMVAVVIVVADVSCLLLSS